MSFEFAPAHYRAPVVWFRRVERDRKLARYAISKDDRRRFSKVSDINEARKISAVVTRWLVPYDPFGLWSDRVRADYEVECNLMPGLYVFEP